jgi:hypothetical protein
MVYEICEGEAIVGAKDNERKRVGKMMMMRGKKLVLGRKPR